MTYGYDVKISDLPDSISLDPGKYMLTTGNRDENGNVLASVSFITLDPGEEEQLRLISGRYRRDEVSPEEK
ncbi:MAG: hypothetical protein MZV63_08185 [Marinilabiliales bacterium]|nr:hypothetical protein [Marinilabiliales bacterium]